MTPTRPTAIAPALTSFDFLMQAVEPVAEPDRDALLKDIAAELQVQPVFDQYICQHGLQHRLKFRPGNFLSDALPKADVLVMGRILHNWDLRTKIMLLRKAYEAVPAGGALIVYERLIDDDRHSSVAGLLASFHMLIMTEGGFDFRYGRLRRLDARGRLPGHRDSPLEGRFSRWSLV